MAKKRVHELAKQYDMPSAEVMTQLNAYGLNVKASASAVDEHEAERALTGKPPQAGVQRQADAAAKRRRRRRPAWASTGRRPRRPSSGSPSASSARRPRSSRRTPTASRPRPARRDGGNRRRRRAAPAPDALLAPGRARPRRHRRRAPRRDRLAGRAPRSRRTRRRSRRWARAARSRRPPRRGGRRRRGSYVEPAAQDVASLKADVIKVNSGSTVKDVGEYLGVPIPEIIKKLMSLGEMATLTQTLSDDAIQVLADEFDKEIEIVHAADEAGDEPEFEDADEELEPRAAGRHDHGPRRPRQDVAAGRDPRDRGGRGRGRRHHPAHRRLPGPPRRQDRSPSSTRPATRRSPPCAPAARSRPTSP